MIDWDAAMSDASPWFVAQLKRNAFIEAERTLKMVGVRVLAPKIQRVNLRYGKRRTQLSLMFPGYLFIEGRDQTKLWHAIRATEGRARLLLNSKRQPRQIPREFMEALLLKYDEAGLPVEAARLSAGAVVHVISGPFAGLIAQIEQVDEQQRVWILLELLGGERRVAFSATNLFLLDR